MPPTVVVISGPPGSGKTSLAAALSARLGWPTVARDAVKAGMVDAAGRQEPPPLGDPLAAQAGDASFKLSRRARRGLVIDTTTRSPAEVAAEVIERTDADSE